jgi:nucleotide-binding universal stress UspA family protein
MRVLLATDGSEDAKSAISCLETFPLPTTARLLALTVATLPYVTPEMLMAPRIDQTFLDFAHRIADEACERLRPRCADVEARVIEGDARDAIVRTAETWHADLVVVGARGLTGMKALLLGSVSTAVVRWSPCPVLVVKKSAHSLERAVVAVDGSPDSMAAARFFASLPLDPDTRVQLLGVVEPPLLPTTALQLPVERIRGMLDDIVRARRTELAGALAQLDPDMKARVRTVEHSVALGRPTEVIVAATDEPGVGLVVLGARGLGPFQRLVLGSVSERVLHRADCAVLIGKGRRVSAES